MLDKHVTHLVAAEACGVSAVLMCAFLLIHLNEIYDLSYVNCLLGEFSFLTTRLCLGNSVLATINDYRIYSRISRPAYKPTPIPRAENVAKISDPRISR